ncbi:MAG: ABC transporter permease [Clostridia bacterium]|nr:ABC transporter permease [Clostridia bacterium]
MTVNFEKNTFNKRIKSMLGVDFRRMFCSPLFYIMVGASLVMPILILVMTTMMDGTVSTNPQTGAETVIEGFKNVWQIIGSVSGGETQMAMDITSMCNINMMFFLIAVFVCIFVCSDFSSGYAKNLFTVRSNKVDYVVSKLVVFFVAGASMLIAFFVGSMLGGVFAGLPFTLEGVNIYNIIMSMLSKIFLTIIFISIYLLASVVAKQKLWLSIIGSFCVGILFYPIAMITAPLNSGILHLVMCLAGGALLGVGFGALSTLILNKRDLF